MVSNAVGVPELELDELLELELLELEELELLDEELEVLLEEELELLLDEPISPLELDPPPPPQALIAADNSVTAPSCKPRIATLSNSKAIIDFSQ